MPTGWAQSLVAMFTRLPSYVPRTPTPPESIGLPEQTLVIFGDSISRDRFSSLMQSEAGSGTSPAAGEHRRWNVVSVMPREA